ncbi:polyhydroxyalkanoate synthesis repressor PhaR [Coralliovum pocilloporae]|uniref:polyhydroxyalkanoate synthesis repressor PhaR n=1 Tax=Coralliovum pocilloporae TaxID=3066369 RepID=UPI003306F155
MTQTDQPTIVKKYANRRLYNTGTSTYVTLEDLAEMVKREEDFVVVDAKSGEDITHSVLTQIIFEQENKGQNLLPIAFLRQLIRFYGDSMQNIVPSYLEYSLNAFTQDQAKLREQMAQSFGVPGFGAMEEQVRRNTEMFQHAMQMFVPFANTTAPEQDSDGKDSDAEKSELDILKTQLAEMQKRIESLSDKSK